MTSITTQELRSYCTKALTQTGLRPADVDIIVDHYLENEFSGKTSHGLVRVIEVAKALKKYPVPGENPEIVLDNQSMVICDAKGQIGPVAGSYAMNLCIERTKQNGMAFCGIRNFIGNSGSMAYYLRRFVDRGLVAIMGCNSVALVAPPGGKKRMIGTNPFGIGIPAGDQPDFIADFATSAIAYGKIMVMNDQGKPLPEGVLVDQDGNPSTNPKDAYDGAILPLADYRGFAIGLMIELLAGPFIGAKACKEQLYDQDGFFMIGFDPAKTGQNDFQTHIAHSLEAIKNSGTQPNIEEITLPGERSGQKLSDTTQKGTVEVVDKTLEKLLEIVNG